MIEWKTWRMLLIANLLLPLAYASAQDSEVAILVGRLETGDIEQRVAAAQELHNLPPRILYSYADHLFSGLNDSESRVRILIAATLMLATAQDSDFTIAANRNKDDIRRALADENPDVRELAAKIVFFLRPAPPAEFSEYLIPLLSDQKSSIKISALGALVRILPIAPRAREAIQVLLHDANPEMKAYAAKGLGELHDGSSETVEGLVGLLKEKSSFARQEAIKALGRIGPPAAAALEALEAILSDHRMDALSRDLAAEAIRAIRGSTSAPM